MGGRRRCSGSGSGSGVGVGVTVGVRLTIGAELPPEPEPVLELERVVTGLEWLMTGLETCVDARAGALAGACARTACDARVRTCTAFALDFATLRREMLDWAADVDPAPESVAGCTGERALSAKAVVGVGGVPTLFGSERATSVPTTTAADVVRTSTARLRAAHRAAPLGLGEFRLGRARPRPRRAPAARRRAAWAPSRSPPAARMTASRSAAPAWPAESASPYACSAPTRSPRSSRSAPRLKAPFSSPRSYARL